LLDAQLRVRLANSAAASLFRTPPERLHGAPMLAVVPACELAAWLRDFHGRQTKVLEIQAIARGRARSVPALRIAAVRLDDTAFTLLVLEDITEKAVLEQQLVDTEKQAAMGQLAAGILHEVSNPLASLGSNLLFVRTALGSNATNDVMKALDTSVDQLDQMRQLLGTLSGFNGRRTPRYELADVQDIVLGCVTFITKEAEQRRIELTVSLAPSPVACEMDVRVIKQVLINLLKNAMEAMPRGGRLDVRTSYRSSDDREPAGVIIEIADTGVGIADSDLRKIFRPLFTTKPRGAGLGLSFCRQAVEEHGGSIRVTSDGRNQGARAVVVLPLRQTPATDD
jgi:signal transduction histidine kinase